MKIKCPECQTTKVTKAGFTWQDRKQVQRYRCGICGRLFLPNDKDKKGE